MKLVVLGLSLSSSWGNGHATTFRALLRAAVLLGALGGKALSAAESAALDDYARAIQWNPADAHAHYNRGVTLLTLERWADALRDFEDAQRLGQDDARPGREDRGHGQQAHGGHGPGLGHPHRDDHHEHRHHREGDGVAQRARRAQRQGPPADRMDGLLRAAGARAQQRVQVC